MLCRLQMFADRLVDRFVASGIMVREYDHVKLHITVMNSRMRKDPSYAIASESDRASTRSGTKDRESFDATRLMQVGLLILLKFVQLVPYLFFNCSINMHYHVVVVRYGMRHEISTLAENKRTN